MPSRTTVRLALLATLVAVALGTVWQRYGDPDRPPRTPEEAERWEREIIAGTRVPRDTSGARAERAEEASSLRVGARMEAVAAVPTVVLERCQKAVGRRFLRKTHFDSVVPGETTLLVSTHRGTRYLSASSIGSFTPNSVPATLPLEGRYVVTGTVHTGHGDNADSRSWECDVRVRGTSVDIGSISLRAIK